jgi:hypothetical protein
VNPTDCSVHPQVSKSLWTQTLISPLKLSLILHRPSKTRHHYCQPLSIPRIQHSNIFSMMLFNNRKQSVDAGVKGVDDKFDLLDLLAIHASSGRVRAAINPQLADERDPVPAELKILSQSGQILVDFPFFNLPKRDYQVSIDSQSGLVKGHIVHGQKTSVTSGSGGIDLQVTPFDPKTSSSLQTESRSGAQRVSLLSPATSGTIKDMSSSHRSLSGALALRYPREWEGTIEGSTKSGKIQVHGSGVEVVRQESDKLHHYLLARKGNGKSKLNFQTGSGGVDIYFE